MNSAVPERSFATLAAALAAHGVELPADRAAPVAAYAELLWEWNDKLNLTRHTDWDRFVARDLLDTLALSALIDPGETVLDIGSGGGVPGLLLAVLRPDLRVTLTEPVGKKARALADMVERLSAPATVVTGRAEEVLARRRFDVVTARAVGSLEKMLPWLAGHWERIGRLLAIKGPKWVEERGEARHRGLMQGLELRRAAVYRNPGADADSVVLAIFRKGATPPHIGGED